MQRPAKKNIYLLAGVLTLLAGTAFNETSADERLSILTANVSAYSGSKPFEGDADAFNRSAAASMRHLLSGVRGTDVRVESNTGVYEGWVEPSLSLRITTGGGKQRDQVLSCLAVFARHYSQHQIHVLQPGGAAATPEPGDFDTDLVRFSLPRPLARAEIEQVIKASGLPGMTFNQSSAEVYYAGNPGDKAAREKFRTAATMAGAEIDRMTGKHGPVRHSTEALQIYGEGAGAAPYAKISTTACPGSF